MKISKRVYVLPNGTVCVDLKENLKTEAGKRHLKGISKIREIYEKKKKNNGI